MTKDLIILNNWERAKRAIAECHDIDEVKKIRNQAEALRAYAKQAKESQEVQNNICEIKLRAEKRIGEFSKELPSNRGDEKFRSSHDGKTDILKEVGILHYERYEAIASLPDELFEKHIQEVKASNKELTTMGLLKLARVFNRPKLDRISKLPEGEFDIIYCDPPWKYDFVPQVERAIEDHYPTMDLDELKELKIPAAKNCLLLLWATAPKLEWAIELIKTWGFEFKTCAVWNKDNFGMGYWFRISHELLLVATKGQFSPPENSIRVNSVYTEKAGKHSKKPDYYYEWIEKSFPNHKYIELFARNKRLNWTSWGTEI